MLDRHPRTSKKTVMFLLGLIMALIVVIIVMGALFFVSKEKSSQATQLPDHPNKPVDTSNFEVPSPWDGGLDVMTYAEEATTPSNFDWAESLVSDIFDYN